MRFLSLGRVLSKSNLNQAYLYTYHKKTWTVFIGFNNLKFGQENEGSKRAEFGPVSQRRKQVKTFQ